jgi:hypothetical protein
MLFMVMDLIAFVLVQVFFSFHNEPDSSETFLFGDVFSSVYLQIARPPSVRAGYM